MTPAETAIREALAAGPTPGPWRATCRDMSYVDGQQWPEDEFLQWEVEGPRPVWGRGDYVQADARLIAACNPANVAELLAELDGERARSQMFADLVRGVAVVLHGEGWSDTSKLPEEVAALLADQDRLRAERKPLTDEAIDEACKSEPAAVYELMHGHEITAAQFKSALRVVARAVERAHGITGD